MKNRKKMMHTIQSCDNDCAIACFTSLFKYYGHKVNYKVIKERINNSNTPTTLKQINSFALSLNLDIRYYDTNTLFNLNNLSFKSFQFPCMCLIEQNNNKHYILIYKIKRKKIIISDPAKGTISKGKSIDIFAKAKFIIYFDNLQDVKIADSWLENRQSLFSDIIKDYQNIIKIISISLLGAILGIITSFQLGILVDYILPTTIFDVNFLLTVCLIILLIIAILNILIDFWKKKICIIFSRKLEKKISLKMVNSLFRLKNNTFLETNVGDIMSRLNECENIVNTLTNILSTSFVECIFFIISIITIFFLNYQLCALLLIFTIISIIISIKNYNSVYNLNFDSLSKHNEYNGAFINIFSDIETIKVLNEEEYRYEIIEKSINQYIASSLRIDNKILTIMSIQQLILYVLNALSLIIGLSFVADESLSMGMLFTIISISSIIIKSTINLIITQFNLESFFVSFSRLNTLLFNNDVENIGNTKINQKVSSISFKDFTLCYNDVLCIYNTVNISFTSKTVLIKGSSGSGKTSILKCIVGLIDNYKGNIFINNINLRNIDIINLRERIIYVSNECKITKGTVYEILCTDFIIPKERVIQVCKDVEILDLINEFPEKFNYLIENKGANLSFGQRQRLALAHAILKEPDVLILDEAISNVDSITKSRIFANLEKYNFIKIYVMHEEFDILGAEKFIIRDKGIHMEGEL